MSTIELRDAAADACCAVSAPADTLTAADAVSLARTMKALADPTRLRLLSLIAAHDRQEACVCNLTAPVNLSQPTVSHHLRVLVDAGFLVREQRGTWAYYSLTPGAIRNVTRSLPGA